MFWGNDHDHPDAHIEDPIHLGICNMRGGLNHMENRRYRPRLRVEVRDYKNPYIHKDYACSPETAGDEQFQAGEVEDYLVKIVD